MFQETEKKLPKSLYEASITDTKTRQKYFMKITNTPHEHKSKNP